MFASRLAGILALVALLGLFLFPTATIARNFSGAGTLWLFPRGIMDLSGFPPEKLPDLGLTGTLLWVLAVSLVLTLVAAWRRQSWLWIAGLISLLLGLACAWAFSNSLSPLIQELVANNVPKRRIPYLTGGINLGILFPIVAGLTALVCGLTASPTWVHRFERFRGVLIPFVSILLSIVVGSIVVLLVQAVPADPSIKLDFAHQWTGKLDLLWFVYSTLFSPLTNINDMFQSLMLATPLIFAGLAVAFAFRTGLFNIGAPGQLVMGSIFAMLVGVYAPLPGWLLAPAGVLAAAFGGALWGFIPGFLKARFGSSEVINTIMLNYVAAGIFVLMLGSNTLPFFGKEYPLPFKAPGFEAKSYPLQEGARLQPLAGMLGLDQPGAALSWAPLLGLILFTLLYLLVRHRYRVLFAATAGVVLTVLLWGTLRIPLDNTVGSHLNTSFFIALVCAWLFAIVMWRTTTGYELRAVGLSPKAAEYGGINVAKNTILAMTIAGGLAGLCGTHYVLGGALDEYVLKQSLPTNVGFDGITIALLGQNTPAGVVVSSILFGVLDTGGLYVDQRLDALNRDIVTLLKALIVLFIAAQGFLSRKITSPPPAVLVKDLEKKEGQA
ncbi:ABC transporter permease [Deinococcus cellulosilyticus NBRC 106333 = KACC 11606]|uniref:ABC transporter permease n=1 Tax=Deinococcus cellulosilyticus (strain DSM 18568 / NBRC 106333 / KACC 11606 / 5516J-15) TaxID=1223518 RepID=A0A511N3K6_DEIC1|nr:ABC transporter permease [Deinococcus cellulosilyticus NBRC 106333 = KACC 11606]